MDFMDRIAEEIRLIEERNEAQERLADYLKVLAKKKDFGRLERAAWSRRGGPAGHGGRAMTRKQAARELMGVWNNYEVRPIKFSTAYRWVFRNKCGFWQLNGHAHNYIV